MPAPQPWPPEYPEPEPEPAPELALDACPLGDDETCQVTSLRAIGRDEVPSQSYRGGAMRRRFGLDDESDDEPDARFDRWRERWP